MNTATPCTCTAFLGHRRVAAGPYVEVDRALRALDLSAGGLLVFDDTSGALVDHPWPPGYGPAQPASTAASFQMRFWTSATPVFSPRPPVGGKR